ncbi:MAG TPA: hypothetical protein PKH92_10235, partial [Anaerolineaceae bacterium]|nr:hypothetical protein [Anaerolineaceae bacterium]
WEWAYLTPIRGFCGPQIIYLEKRREKASSPLDYKTFMRAEARTPEKMRHGLMAFPGLCECRAQLTCRLLPKYSKYDTLALNQQ